MKLIAVCGQAGVGKGTASDYLATQYNFESLAFADELKRVCEGIFNIYNVTRETKEEVMHVRVYDDNLRFILKNMGYTTHQIGTIKNMFFEVFKEYIFSWNDNSVDLNVSPRRIFQLTGTNWMRELDSDIWVNRVDERITKCKYPKVVMNDLRFDNEAEYVHNKGGKIILVESKRDYSVAEHISELGISPDYISYVINNDTSFESLYRQIDEIMAEI